MFVLRVPWCGYDSGSLTEGFWAAGFCVILQSRYEEPGDAVGIISRGPEPLASQFTTGYSMVLNVLSTRTLSEARSFISRSFNNYLGKTSSLPRPLHVYPLPLPKPLALFLLIGFRCPSLNLSFPFLPGPSQHLLDYGVRVRVQGGTL